MRAVDIKRENELLLASKWIGDAHHQPCWYPIGVVMCIAIPAPSLRGQWICSQNEGAAMCSRVVQRQAGRMEHRYLLDRNNQEEPAVVEAGCRHALKKCIAGRSDPLLQRVWRPIRRSSRTRRQHGPASIIPLPVFAPPDQDVPTASSVPVTCASSLAWASVQKLRSKAWFSSAPPN